LARGAAQERECHTQYTHTYSHTRRKCPGSKYEKVSSLADEDGEDVNVSSEWSILHLLRMLLCMSTLGMCLGILITYLESEPKADTESEKLMGFSTVPTILNSTKDHFLSPTKFPSHSTPMSLTQTPSFTTTAHTKKTFKPLCFEHFPKAGGTFIKGTLHKRMKLPKKVLIISYEFQNKCDHEKHFVIGNIRDPCSYYISLWSFGCDNSNHNGALRNFFKYIENGKKYVKLFYQDSYNATQFGSWLHFMSSLNDFGIFSYRLGYKFGGGTNPGNNLGIMNSTRDRDEDEYSFRQVPKNVHCWVHQENEKEDLRQCLQEYETFSGYSFNWETFESATNHAKKNPSKHNECNFYWTDDLKRYLYEKDKIVIDILNLGCCGEPFPA